MRIMSLTQQHTSVIKGLAIIAMILHHLFYDHSEYGFFIQQLGLICKVCVAIFLFLSGYGLTIQFTKIFCNGLGNIVVALKFLFNRYVKFYLSYWFIFIIFVPIGIYIFGRDLSIPYGNEYNILYNLLKDIIGISGFHSYNITWWFNQLILKLYLFFPLLFILTRKKSLGLLILTFSYRYPEYFPFILGMTIASNQEWINKMFIRMKYISVVSVLFVLLLCVFRQISSIHYASGTYLDGFIAAFLSFFVVSVCQSKGNKYLEFLGKHSFNMYMTHTFIISYFFHDFVYSLKYPVLIFPVVLFSTLVISIILEFTKHRMGVYKIQHMLLRKI